MTLTTREKKIINDILYHLDGWRINDHPPKTRKISSFLDEDDPHFNNNIRKEVSSREVLTSYDKAKIHALNYIRRKQFPNSPAIYEAITYWAAGLLSERAHFKDEKIDKSTLLIEEARRLLSPHVKRGDDFFTVSGDDFFWEQYLRSESQPRPRRDRVPYNPDERVDEEKERLTHGHSPRREPPVRRPCSPEHVGREHWIKPRPKNKYKIKVDPIISDDDEIIDIKARVTNRGKPCDSGRLLFYVYEEDD